MLRRPAPCCLATARVRCACLVFFVFRFIFTTKDAKVARRARKKAAAFPWRRPARQDGPAPAAGQACSYPAAAAPTILSIQSTGAGRSVSLRLPVSFPAKQANRRRDMIDFWVSIGSTYSYLSVMRLKSVEEASGVPFRWRPFSVRAVMIEQENIPFVGKPVKMVYMWRDIERRAGNTGSSRDCPPPIRWRNSTSPTRSPSWPRPRAGAPTTSAPLIGNGSIRGMSRDRSRAFPRSCAISAATPPASSPRPRPDGSKSATSATPRKPRRLGVFGSPTFVVDGEVFWGDDRLEDAIDWFKAKTAGRSRGRTGLARSAGLAAGADRDRHSRGRPRRACRRRRLGARDRLRRDADAIKIAPRIMNAATARASTETTGHIKVANRSHLSRSRSVQAQHDRLASRTSTTC